MRTSLEFDPPIRNMGAFPSITSLRALPTSSIQLSALKNLTHLRYQKLYKSCIKTLPKSIYRLQRLQILRLEHCDYHSSLPKQLTQSQDLRHIMIKNCNSLASTPPTFIVGSEIGFGLTEFYKTYNQEESYTLNNYGNGCILHSVANTILKRVLHTIVLYCDYSRSYVGNLYIYCRKIQSTPLKFWIFSSAIRFIQIYKLHHMLSYKYRKHQHQ